MPSVKHSERFTMLHFAWIASLLLAIPLTACKKPARPICVQPVPVPAVTPIEVETHADIAYRTGPDADLVRHKLDIYVPKGRKDFPVLFFVHGGGWNSGEKNLYSKLGELFVKDGFGVVVTNYRLTPAVLHPGHIEDVAGAFAWTFANIAKYGGDPKKIFVFGHSAGAHLVSLLATDPSYLKAEKRTPADVRGVISLSGVYVIPHDLKSLQPVFGKVAEDCKRASPITHVSGNHPPFLIAYAEKDYKHFDTMAIDMDAALQKSKSPCKLMKCTDRDHITIIAKIAEPEDALHKAIREFVFENAR